MAYKRQRRAQGLQIRDFGDGGERRIKEKLESDVRRLQTEADAVEEHSVREYQNYKEAAEKQQRQRAKNQDWIDQVANHQQDALEKRKVSEVNYHKQKESQFRKVQQDWEYLSPILAKNAANVANAAHGAWSRMEAKKGEKKAKAGSDEADSEAYVAEVMTKAGILYNQSQRQKGDQKSLQGDNVGALEAYKKDAFGNKHQQEGAAKYAMSVWNSVYSKIESEIDSNPELAGKPLHVRNQYKAEATERWLESIGIGDAKTPNVQELKTRIQNLKNVRDQAQYEYEYDRDSTGLKGSSVKNLLTLNRDQVLESPEVMDVVNKALSVHSMPDKLNGQVKSFPETLRSIEETFVNLTWDMEEGEAIALWEKFAGLMPTRKDEGYQASKPTALLRYPESLIRVRQRLEEKRKVNKESKQAVDKAKDKAEINTGAVGEFVTNTLNNSENQDQARQTINEKALEYDRSNMPQAAGALRLTLATMEDYGNRYEKDYYVSKVAELAKAKQYGAIWNILNTNPYLQKPEKDKILAENIAVYKEINLIEDNTDAKVTDFLTTLVRGNLGAEAIKNPEAKWDTVSETISIARGELFRLYEEKKQIDKDGIPRIPPAQAWKEAKVALRELLVKERNTEGSVWQVYNASKSDTGQALYANQYKNKSIGGYYHKDFDPAKDDIRTVMENGDAKIFSEPMIKKLQRAVQFNAPLDNAFRYEIRKWVANSGGKNTFYEVLNDQFKAWGIETRMKPGQRELILSSITGAYRPGYKTLKQFLRTSPDLEDIKIASVQADNPRAIGTVGETVVNTIDPKYQDIVQGIADTDTVSAAAGLLQGWENAGNKIPKNSIIPTSENRFKVDPSIHNYYITNGQKYGLYYNPVTDDFYYEDD